MIQLRAKTNPFDDIVRFLGALEHPDAADQDYIADSIRQGFAENFANEQNGDGTPWAPLAPATVTQRGSAHPILVRTGLGRASFTQQGATDHIQRLITQPGGWTLEVGSENEIMMMHATGTRYMPARPMGELSDRAERNVERRMDAYIARLEAQILGD